MVDIGEPDDAPHLALKVLDFLTGDENRLKDFLQAVDQKLTPLAETSTDLLRVALDYAATDEAILMQLQYECQIRPASILVGSFYLGCEAVTECTQSLGLSFNWPLFC